MINPMSEKEWKKAVGIVEKEEYTPFIAKRSASHRNVQPTSDNHIKSNIIVSPNKAPTLKKAKAVKPVKITYTKEEMKVRRREQMQKKRAEFKKQGLTSNGTIPKIREKKVMPIEELRARQVNYSKEWRANNREKHLKYRRDYKKRKREEIQHESY
jgi:hypothetical protein